MSIRYVVLLPVTLLIMVSVFVPSDRAQSKQRNLADYKEGPSLDLEDEFLDAKKTNEQIAPARKFLWQLWKSRTKGYLKRTSYSREGNPGWCTFFVEPDPRGQWRVVLECKTSMCPYISEARCREYLRTVASETYYSL